MKIGQIRKVIGVSANDINDILVGAFEGGSNYWIDKVSERIYRLVAEDDNKKKQKKKKTHSNEWVKGYKKWKKSNER